MYSGITQGLVPVVSVHREPTLLSYEVELPEPLLGGLKIGASVSIDGVCQTVTKLDGNRVRFDAISETLRLTTLDTLDVGDLVSVERSCKFGDELGGHELAGHVRGTGIVSAVHQDAQTFRLGVSVPGEWMKYILQKGFIAVDGSSLTVGEVNVNTPSPAGANPQKDGPVASWGAFDLHLIPETLRLTKLGKKPLGSRVNVELDSRTVAIVDTVERVLDQRFSQGSS